MSFDYFIVYRRAVKHSNKWKITELQLKKGTHLCSFFAELMNGVTLNKAFTFLLAFFIIPS